MPEFKPGFTSLDYFINNSFLGKAAPGDERGFLRTSRFAAKFTLPVNVEFLTGETVSKNVIEDFMESNVKSMEIPAVTITEAKVGIRTHIGDRNPSDITITFFESPGLSIHDSVRNWINDIVDLRSDSDNFARKYLDDVTAIIELFPILGSGSRANRKQVFTDVFPISVNPIQLNIEEDNIVGTTVVRFRYRFHTVETV